MYYEINVSLMGRHFFATDKRSATSKYAAVTLYRDFKKRFPQAEGFEISVTYYELTGHIMTGEFEEAVSG